MACRWIGVLLLGVACAVGCSADGDIGLPRGTGASGGTAAAGGMGGLGGQSGMDGTAGMSGTGGSGPECVTNLVCQSFPTQGRCDTDEECAVGSVCIESGCEDLDAMPIRHCVFAGGGACNTSEDCPTERECMEVPLEGPRCVKTTPGCTTMFDCVPGFSCEDGSCVDRRVPCAFDVDCPKNHTCLAVGVSRFCVRIHRDCAEDFDCIGLAPRCEDIDGDGKPECAGVLDSNAVSPTACINAECSEPAAPVCEAEGLSGTTTCGQYGLCLDDTGCADGFVCASLWPDGRKECVPEGGSCSSFADCPIRQVCAAAQEGGAPRCQAGVAP
jgi:hypothetical protein